MTKEISQLRIKIFTIEKSKENNSIIETKYDKHGNKFSMHENI